MLYFFQIICLTLVLVLIGLTEEAPCKKQLKLKRTLNNLRKKYFLVEKLSTPNTQVLPRSKRDVTSGQTASTYCPWSWVKDTSLPRSRSNLLRAECVGKCKSYCKPVYYTMRVLVKKGRDSRTKMDIWTLTTKRIVVAYFYKRV